MHATWHDVEVMGSIPIFYFFALYFSVYMEVIFVVVTTYTLGNDKRPLTFDEISGYMNILLELHNRFVGEGQYECYSYFNLNGEYCTVVKYSEDVLTDDEIELLGQEFDVRLQDIFGPMEGA